MLYKLVDRDYCSIMACDKYRKRYLPKTFVSSDAATFGLMLFTTYEQALLFVNAIGMRQQLMMKLRPLIILAVEGIGERFKPKFISISTSEIDLDSFYYSNHSKIPHILPPDGTICYPKVKVIEQYGPPLLVEEF